MRKLWNRLTKGDKQYLLAIVLSCCLIFIATVVLVNILDVSLETGDELTTVETSTTNDISVEEEPTSAISYITDLAESVEIVAVETVETAVVATIAAPSELEETVEPETQTILEDAEVVVEETDVAAREETVSETEVVESTEVTTTYIEPETEVVVETTESEQGMSDIEMLALIIYQEVGGDMHCDECRRRVADVVLNRVADDRFPDNIYDVLVQPGQYGALSWTGLIWASRASSQWEAPAVERAYRIAEEVLNGQHSELYGNGYVWQAGFVQGSDNIYCCGHYFGR